MRDEIEELMSCEPVPQIYLCERGCLTPLCQDCPDNEDPWDIL